MMMDWVIRNRLLILQLVSLIAMISSTNAAPNQSKSSNNQISNDTTTLEKKRNETRAQSQCPYKRFQIKRNELLIDLTSNKEIDIESIKNRFNLLEEHLEKLYKLYFEETGKHTRSDLKEFSKDIYILKVVLRDYIKKSTLREQDEKFQQNYTDIVKAIQDKQFKLAENKLNEMNDMNKVKNVIISAYKKSNYTAGNLLKFIDYIKEPNMRFSLYRTLYEYIIETQKDRVSKPNNIFNYGVSTTCDLMRLNVFLINDTIKNIYPEQMSENVGKIQNEFDEIFRNETDRAKQGVLVMYKNKDTERNLTLSYLVFYEPQSSERCYICYGWVTCIPVPLMEK